MKPTTKKLPGWVHIPLAVFMAISFWETAQGFKYMFGDLLAYAFSAAITMLLYGFTILVGYRRINRLSVIGFLIAYFFFSLFSFTGNFNAIYTQYQKAQLYREELQKHQTQLDEVVSRSEKALNNFSPDITEKLNRVEALTEQLISQITDPNRPGLGKRALELIKEIESLLGERLTEFGTRGGDWKAIAERYRENIDQIARRKITTKDYDQINAKKEFIKENYDKAKQRIDEIISDNDELRSQGREANKAVVDYINKIGTEIENFINNTTVFKFEKVSVENDEVGKVHFSFKSAFQDHFFIAILFTILCLFIDWAVMLSLLVFFGRNEKEPVKVVRSNREM